MNKQNGNGHSSNDASTVLHDIEAIEDFVRDSGLPREADELHVISERVRVALASGNTGPYVISLAEARRVLDEIRRERDEGPTQDIQRALA